MTQAAIQTSMMNPAVATLYVAVTTSDSADLPNGPCRALYIGAAGNVAISPYVGGGQQVTFVGLNAGTILPCAAARVYATNTTATSIVALY